MTIRLIADVGGTNTRVGLADSGVLRANTVYSYRNDSYADFADVMDDYLADHDHNEVDEIVVAIAGPVTGATARLTNRNWHFDTRRLSERFNGAKVGLMNDLMALGQAVAVLGPTSLDPVHAPDDADPDGQAVVIGIGTGFNVSPILQQGGHVLAGIAEYGHLSLHHDIIDALRSHIGDQADAFTTTEHLFSGRGFASVFSVLTGAAMPETDQIDPKNNADHRRVMGIYAELMAILTRNLLLAFMPRRGVYFAGGVARNVLASDARADFLRVYTAPMDLGPDLVAPAFSILDDAAALKGCARFAIDG